MQATLVNAQALASFVEIRDRNNAKLEEAKDLAQAVMNDLKILLKMHGVTATLFDSSLTLDCNNGPKLSLAQLVMKIEQDLRAQTAHAALSI